VGPLHRRDHLAGRRCASESLGACLTNDAPAACGRPLRAPTACAHCVRPLRAPTSGSFCDRFTPIVPTMLAKRSQKSARCGPLRCAVPAPRKPGVAIALRSPCFAQARSGHPWPLARRMRLAHGHSRDACVAPSTAPISQTGSWRRAERPRWLVPSTESCISRFALKPFPHPPPLSSHSPSLRGAWWDQSSIDMWQKPAMSRLSQPR
jgi:hypothetical protein